MLWPHDKLRETGAGGFTSCNKVSPRHTSKRCSLNRLKPLKQSNVKWTESKSVHDVYICGGLNVCEGISYTVKTNEVTFKSTNRLCETNPKQMSNTHPPLFTMQTHTYNTSSPPSIIYRVGVSDEVLHSHTPNMLLPFHINIEASMCVSVLVCGH